MSYPVVMKIVSPDILHKTEAGGVMVGITSDAEAKAAYDTILNNARPTRPTPGSTASRSSRC